MARRASMDSVLVGTVASALMSAMVLMAPCALAGPITPPPGPVASTPGPEPRIAINGVNTPGDSNSIYKISQPGSYYLTGNLAGASGKHGIEITASDVSIDLMGFVLTGVAGSLDGISATADDLDRLSVVNGSVLRFGGDGVDLGTTNGTGSRIERIHAVLNGGEGIRAATSAVVATCTASQNGGNGIGVGYLCIITDCTARGNGGYGIALATGSVSGCSSNLNDDNGFQSYAAVSFVNCSAYGGRTNGFEIGDGGSATDCAAHSNSDDGFVGTYGATFTSCQAYDNLGNGFNVNEGCLIEACTARLNALDGFRIDNDCVIRGCVSDSNGVGLTIGAGIRITSTDNRIESNQCSDCDVGIDADAGGNVLVRNTCADNDTNWILALGNFYGTIIDRTTTLGSSVNGNEAPGSLGSTDANANFSY